MRQRFVIIAFLLIAGVSYIAAQHTLYDQGRVVAYGIHKKNEMPEALSHLFHRREHSNDKVFRSQMQLSGETTVGPLLQSIRDQEEPYNLLCPYWTDAKGKVSEERCLSGCVATAIEQVLAYHRYPEMTLDSLAGWETPNYCIETLPAGTRFDWDNYLFDYRKGWTEKQGLAIALPTLAAGMAVHMNYGLNASGADTERAVEPLHRVFGYPMVRYYNRLLFSPQRWHAMVRHELEHNRPIVYTGYNMPMSGHAFNIDGISADGFYHVNWGYNGNYDGWYNPDWLDPWEPVQEDSLGIAEGMFCNHYALFMGPNVDDVPLEPDSFQIDKLGVVCDSVIFCRQPDLQGYVGMDFYFHNTSEDTITYTYEVFTNSPTDTTIFEQADFISVSAINLLPEQHKMQRVYGRFKKTGQRILGISHDDITRPFTQNISVVNGATPTLEWGDVFTAFAAESALTGNASFTFEVKNTAQSGVAGNLVTCCLFEEGRESEDLRHYRILNLPAKQDSTLHVTFDALLPNTNYTFIVRCPWTIQKSVTFTTPDWTYIKTLPSSTPFKFSGAGYDLSGRSIHSPQLGIYITNGKKYLFPHR